MTRNGTTSAARAGEGSAVATAASATTPSFDSPILRLDRLMEQTPCPRVAGVPAGTLACLLRAEFERHAASEVKPQREGAAAIVSLVETRAIRGQEPRPAQHAI